MFKAFLEFGDVLAVLAMNDSEDLEEVFFDGVEAEGVFIVDKGQLFGIVHKVIDDFLAVQIDDLVNFLICFEVLKMKKVVLDSESIRLTKKLM